jgi:hypothetical protein
MTDHAGINLALGFLQQVGKAYLKQATYAGIMVPIVGNAPTNRWGGPVTFRMSRRSTPIVVSLLP